jgi:hypothetical protein
MLFAPLFLISLGVPTPPVPAIPDRWDGRTLTVHEWGTFTAVQGSDGVVLDGLRHDDRDLPPFVYDLGQRVALTGVSPKMETPVVYMYAPAKWVTHVRVQFPHGLLTQWYPAATSANMADEDEGFRKGWKGELAASPRLEKGFLSWGDMSELTVLPRGVERELPAVREGDPWLFARAVDANMLEVGNVNLAIEQREKADKPYAASLNESCVRQRERFLFYRGLGDFALPLQAIGARASRKGDVARLSLRLENADPKAPLAGVFLIWVDGDMAGFRALDDVHDALDLTPVDVPLRPVADVTKDLVDHVAARLAETPLYADEALAMARTWAHAWFGDPGLRVLYILPRAFVDRELPLEVGNGWIWNERGDDVHVAQQKPVVERAFVGRLEILTRAQELELLATVERCLRGTEKERASAEAELARHGRFLAPCLRRLLALTEDPELLADVRTRLERCRTGS